MFLDALQHFSKVRSSNNLDQLKILARKFLYVVENNNEKVNYHILLKAFKCVKFSKLLSIFWIKKVSNKTLDRVNLTCRHELLRKMYSENFIIEYCI